MQLNPEQLDAADHFKGPCVVSATPGSGKTRVLTCRVVNLIKKGIKPQNLLCLTFTNKAANEMRERVSADIGETANSVWISTFHSLCVAILRKYGHMVGLKKQFSIYDENSQKELMKKISRMGEYELNDNEIWNVVNTVNSFREGIVPFDDYTADKEEHVKSMMLEYLSLIDEFQAVDFSGLQFKTYELLTKYPQVVQELVDRFQFIMIDEGQDTNSIQYAIVKKIGVHGNLFIVGDYNQSIFSWRNAKPENLNEIKKDFKDVREITLPRNYRSTKQILEAAESLIRKNSNATDVSLISMRGDGNKVRLSNYLTPQDEADGIARAIEKIKDSSGYNWKDFAVLYRTNMQSKMPEAALRVRGVPYRIIGGFSFFDRAEIKTSMAYMTLLANPHDTVAFQKAISNPTRGVGEQTIGRLEKLAMEQKISIFDACKQLHQIAGVNKKAQTEIHKFVDLYAKCSEASTSDAVSTLLMDSGYYAYMQKQSEQDQSDVKRVTNIEELLTEVQTYFSDNPNSSLADYLQSIQLMSDKSEDDNDAVSLLTIHAAKGLEFPIVFIIGAEEKLLPHNFCDNIEEERRLLYVAMTRAKDFLQLSFCRNRLQFNKNARKNEFIPRQPSRFLVDIDIFANTLKTIR